MQSISRPFLIAIRLPSWKLPRLFDPKNGRRRRATIDLIHASPHLLRDIGAIDTFNPRRGS